MSQNRGFPHKHLKIDDDGQKLVCEHSDTDPDEDDDEDEDGWVAVNPDEDEDDDDGEFEFSKFDLRKSQIALAKLSCSEGRAIGTSPAFKNFAQSCNPFFHITPEVLNQDIMEIYEQEKSMAKHALAIFDGQICLSVDTCWYEYDRVQFICISAHFIDSNWEIKKWVLKFCRIWQCDSELFGNVVLSLKDWEIEGKILSLTKIDADLDSNEVLNIKKRVEEKKKKLQLDGKLFEVECCAGVFNLMADDAYKEIPNIITKVQKLMENRWSFLPVWNLVAFKLKEAFDWHSTGEFSGSSYQIPSVDEWEKVRCVSELVIKLYNIVKPLFEAKNPTAYIFLQKFQEIREMLQESTEGDDFTSTMAKNMLKRLDKYWSGTQLTLAIASVMDPRCKMTYFDYLYSKGEMNGNKLPSSDILNAIRDLFGDYVRREEERERSESGSTSSDSDDDDPTRTLVGEKLIDIVNVEGYNQFINSISLPPPKSDLERYLEEPVVPWSQDFKVLKWWKAESLKYPILSKMARDMLAVPMSVATSHDAYYKEKNADRKLVTSGPDNIRNALMCTRSWAKKH